MCSEQRKDEGDGSEIYKQRRANGISSEKTRGGDLIRGTSQGEFIKIKIKTKTKKIVLRSIRVRNCLGALRVFLLSFGLFVDAGLDGSGPTRFCAPMFSWPLLVDCW